MQPVSQEYTFLFTDIEGSTALWERHPEAMRTALARHDAILRDAARQQDGDVFKTAGDAFYIAFPTPQNALNAAVAAQHALFAENWEEIGAIRVRMALHIGPAERRDDDYFGSPLNIVARLRDVGHGGQLLVSETFHQYIGSAELPGGIYEDCGEHPLRGLDEPIHIYQISIEGLPTEFPRLRSDLDGYYQHNLPADTTSFVGREDECRVIREILTRKGARLVTLTGMGGVGKTRLALSIAEQMLWRYRDGIWYVDLAVLSGAADLIPAIARAAGLKEDPAKTPARQIAEHFRTAKSLLVFDNFERYSDAADDVATLLRATEHLQIVVTSRELLNLSMEHEYPVPPLAASECTALFAARAAQARPDFDPAAPATHAELEALCARLEGMPLAVELAAAQMRSLSPAEIREALDQRLEVLSSRMRDLHPRHRSLRSTIDWSYELLSETEQRLFRALSCFTGGFTAEAVRRVCGEPCGITTPTMRPISAINAVKDALRTLREKSLVRQDQINAEVYGEAPADGTRFSLLESLREYGQEILDSEDTALRDELGDRHMAYYRELVEAQEPLLSGQGQLAATVLLEREAANIRVARERALTLADWETAVQFAKRLRRFWTNRGWLREGQEYLDRVLEYESRIPEPSLRAEALFVAGHLNWSGARSTLATTLLERCVALCRETQPPFPGAAALEGRALTVLGMAAYSRGEMDAADRYYADALVLRRAQGDAPGEAALLTNIGIQAMARGRFDKAMEMFEQALPLRKQQGDSEMIAHLWNCIGAAAEAAGELERAHEAFAHSMDLFEQLGAAVYAAHARINLGHVAYDRGRWTEAKRHYEEARTALHPEQEQRGIPECLTGLARIALAMGAPERALALGREALALYHEAGDRKGLATGLQTLAEIVVIDDAAAARRFFMAAQHLCREMGVHPGRPDEQRIAELTARLGPTDAGDTADMERTITEALHFRSEQEPLSVR
jgi:predicted ATPase/class 3 adenylate cyclase/Tfp pilus assembly protein PilF